MVGSISCRSVAQIIREGYFAAQIQLGHGMKMAESMTLSADGTGHRSINYNSRHAHMLVEDYKSPRSGKHVQLDFLESNHPAMALANSVAEVLFSPVLPYLCLN
jgi:hypothetical protein